MGYQSDRDLSSIFGDNKNDTQREEVASVVVNQENPAEEVLKTATPSLIKDVLDKG